MAMNKLGKEDNPRDFMGPTSVDLQIRQAIQMLWMITPPAKRSSEAVEREFRRLVDRALRDYREDSDRPG